MDIKILAAILLLGHLVSVGFILSVLRRQIQLFKTPVIKGLETFRRVLFALSVVIFFWNLAPIAIDTLTIVRADELGRLNPSVMATVYSISNVLAAIASSFLIWVLYRISKKTATAVDEQLHKTITIRKP